MTGYCVVSVGMDVVVVVSCKPVVEFSVALELSGNVDVSFVVVCCVVVSSIVVACVDCVVVDHSPGLGVVEVSNVVSVGMVEVSGSSVCLSHRSIFAA